MRYRLALCGFSEFEYRAMRFSFQHPASDDSGYEIVDSLAESDFAVVDADSKPAVKGVMLSGRVGQAIFVGDAAPPGAAAHLPRPIDPTRILRTLDQLSAQRPPEAVAEQPAAAAPTSATRPPPPVLMVSVPTPAVTEKRSAARAAARAKTRRARLAHVRSDPDQAEPLRDVLVLEEEAEASAQLCTLLGLFGFEAHAVQTLGQAAAVVTARPYAAIFLDIALDGADRGEGLALLETIHNLPLAAGQVPPAVVMVTAQLNPADRVRAALAGIGAPLVKPVTRGDVARALESRSVVLPADARRT